MQRLKKYEDACFLACESREAVVVFDDLHDRLTDNPDLIQELGMEQKEIDHIFKGLRRLMDRSYDFKNRVGRDLAQDLLQVPPVVAAEADGAPEPGTEEEQTKPTGHESEGSESEDTAGNTSPAFGLDEAWRLAEDAHAHLPASPESTLLPMQDPVVEATAKENSA